MGSPCNTASQQSTQLLAPLDTRPTPALPHAQRAITGPPLDTLPDLALPHAKHAGPQTVQKGLV